MRDADRIDPMIEQLRAAWKANPDLRLGQLVYNAARPAEPCPRLFYIEDGPLLAGLAYRLADPWDACAAVDPFTGQPDQHEHGDACEGNCE